MGQGDPGSQHQAAVIRFRTFHNVSFKCLRDFGLGSFATGSSHQKVKPCLLCTESRPGIAWQRNDATCQKRSCDFDFQLTSNGGRNSPTYAMSANAIDVLMAPKKRSFWKTLTGASPAPLKIYLNFASSDGRDYARRLADWLSDHGYDIVLPADEIKPGEDWTRRLTEEIQGADVMIVIWTPAASVSKWVLRELNFFAERQRGPFFAILFPENLNYESIPRPLRERQGLTENNGALHEGPSNQALERILDALASLTNSVSRTERPRPSAVSQEKLPLNEGKLILVGRGEVGKTSLVRRLAENDFWADESKTQGIKITNWSLQCNSDLVRLNVWDFGGQEIMHATHQFFLTERSLYLLVLNGREGGEDVDAEYWLKHIESFGADLPVIVVQNKISQHPFDLNYRGLQARYPQINGFVKTDCKEEIGLDELRELDLKRDCSDAGSTHVISGQLVKHQKASRIYERRLHRL